MSAPSATSLSPAQGKAPGPLVVFMTCGLSLETWREAGILSRELALYERLKKFFPEIVFLTYGGETDSRIAEEFGFRALPKRSRMDPFRYSFFAPWFYRRELKRAAVLKTNQFDGAWAAGVAKVFFRKPLVVRGGYLLSLRAERENWSRKGRWWARHAEGWCCRRADRVMITTESLRGELLRRYRLPDAKVIVSPNFVDTNRFRPEGPEAPVRGRIGYVGRLEREKNLDMVIRAVAGIEGAELVVVGEGTLRGRLEQEARRIGAKVGFLGTLPNERLPGFYQECEMVVLASEYEGHPKVVLEAMACGRPVIGANVPGIRDVIEDGLTGLLFTPSADALAEAVRRLWTDPTLAAEIGRRARIFAVREFSLDAAADRELGVYRELLGLK